MLWKNFNEERNKTSKSMVLMVNRPRFLIYRVIQYVENENRRILTEKNKRSGAIISERFLYPITPHISIPRLYAHVLKSRT